MAQAMTLQPLATTGQAPVTALTPETAYLISDWPAAQSGRVRWSPDNVTLYPDGSFDLHLTEAPEGSWRPYLSGEVASVATATHGTWTWLAQVPRMVDGAVFGMFTFQADARDPRVEFDFEFVGADTTQLELNVHMAGPDGKNVALAGGPYKVQLGFDAAAGVHSYAVTVTEGQAIFLIDGVEVARFGPEDMTNGVWREGEMRSYVDLWPVSNDGMQNWAGVWDGSGVPMSAHVAVLDVPGGDVPPPDPTPDPTPDPPVEPPTDPVPDPDPGDGGSDGGGSDGGGTDGGGTDGGGSDGGGTDGGGSDGGGSDGGGSGPGTPGTGGQIIRQGNTLLGTDGADLLIGGRGRDILRGGAGEDTLIGGHGNDILDGGDGTSDWASIGNARKALVLDLGNPLPQATGKGMVTLKGIENLAGGPKGDRLKGDSGPNTLDGNGGPDRLKAGPGPDRLIGGPGKDQVDGGVDMDVDTFVFRSVLDSRAIGKQGGDTILNFVSGVDQIDLAAIDADARQSGHQTLSFDDGPAAHSVWITTRSGSSVVLADVTGDGRAELRIFVQGLVTADDLIL